MIRSSRRHPHARSLLSTLLLTAAVVTGSVATTAPPTSATEVAMEPIAAVTKHDPVLFVHGFTRSSADFAPFIERYVRNGWSADRLYTIDYNSFYPNAYTGALIAGKVAQIRAETGAAKVDIVAHSMGNMGTRFYLKNLGGTAFVRDYVSISGPNHGTLAAYTPECAAIPSCAEMQPTSAFLAQLNDGDETPGAVNYYTVWSTGDDLIFPAESSKLDGAWNWQHPLPLTHMEVAVDEETIVQSRNFVRS
jgi:triacylglycerol lipase